MSPDADLLAIHRALVETPSLSHQETALADAVEALLRAIPGAAVDRVGDNVIARAGAGPKVVLCSHLDTVPPCDGWTRPPHEVAVEDGRIYGLGSNDAKASVAAMIDTFRQVAGDGGPCEVALMLVPEEETGGKGAEVAWPWLRDAGWVPDAVVVGEPTGLDVAVAQKGMLILRLECEGDACHSANARAIGARNAARALARGLVRLEDVDLGPEHPFLGPTTLEPTVIRAGETRNQVPDAALAWLDCRTAPVLTHEELTARVRAAVGDAGEVVVHSDRLRARECPPDAPVLEAARRARPGARHYGSATMSDLVYFDGVPAIKVGPGQTERSHRADEFVLASEVEEGARFYRELLRALAAVTEEGRAG